MDAVDHAASMALQDQGIGPGSRLLWDSAPPALRASRMKELVEWVNWLDATYLRYCEYAFKPCWWRHPDVLGQVTALKDAFDAAYGTTEPGPEAIAWHEAWLWPSLERVDRVRSMRECTAREHKPSAQPTIRRDPTLRRVLDGWMSGDNITIDELAQPDDIGNS